MQIAFGRVRRKTLELARLGMQVLCLILHDI